MGERIKDYFSDNRRTAITLFAVLAVIVLIIGLTLTWFVGGKTLSTVGKVKKPTTIRVLGPNETAMEEIPLTYEPTEFADHKVHLTRTFSVVSDEKGFTLYLAHTTNISDLDIKLYRVTDVTGQEGESTAQVAQIDNDGNRYAWNRSGGNLYTTEGLINPVDGTADHIVAKDIEQQIFGSYDENKIQKNAIPLYWKYEGAINHTDANAKKQYYNSKGDLVDSRVTNFIIDLSWTDSDKETDILYLIARS